MTMTKKLVHQWRRSDDSTSEPSRVEPLLLVSELIQRLRGMFRDVPGTQLSIKDAARLSGIERSTCRHILEALADMRFLIRGGDGTFTLRQGDTVDR
jgi:response regulator of citrate/malate metabolism